MNPALAQGGFTRRQFLGGGTAALLAFAGGGWLAARITDGTPAALATLKHLGAGEQQMLARIADAVLDGVLPQEGPAREAWFPRLLQNIDTAISCLPNELQIDTKKLLSMLAFAPTRLLVIGQWGGWQAATRADVTARLQAMIDSGSPTRHVVYRVVRDLCAAAFYGDRRSWELIGYPGPVINKIENG
jgi:hypothetical protein